MKLLFAFAACVLALIAAPLADARTLRHPGDNGPGITLDVPDAWMSQVSNDNLLVRSDTRTIALSITVGQAEADFDAIAAQIHPQGATPLVRAENATVAGRTAAVFNATMTGRNGTADLTVTMFEIGHGYVASVSRIERSDATPETRAQADAVMQTMQVVE